MHFEFGRIKAILYDFGNTLVEFSYRHLEQCDAALALALKQQYGPVDHQKLVRIRNKDRLAPYQGDFIENDLIEITHNLVHSLYSVKPDREFIDHLLKVRFEAFVTAIELPDYLQEHLKGLRKNYKIGLLSNYPCGKAIRTSLDRIGIGHLFHSVFVSADIGYVKPHPSVFKAIVQDLQVDPQDCLFVGDNWLGDIQGAKRVGMKAIHSTQFDTPEKFDPQPGDYEADATIEHLLDLENILGAPC